MKTARGGKKRHDGITPRWPGDRYNLYPFSFSRVLGGSFFHRSKKSPARDLMGQSIYTSSDKIDRIDDWFSNQSDSRKRKRKLPKQVRSSSSSPTVCANANHIGKLPNSTPLTRDNLIFWNSAQDNMPTAFRRRTCFSRKARLVGNFRNHAVAV